MLSYKGFTGEVEIDFETHKLYGKVTEFPPAYSACYSDTTTFQGETVAQVAKAFNENVDDYLDFYEYLTSMEQTSDPIAANVKMRVFLAAKKQNTSTTTWLTKVLLQAAHETLLENKMRQMMRES